MNNYKLLINATESFTQLMIFLRDERGYKDFKLKIGKFNYDYWSAEIYCILDESGDIFFKHEINEQYAGTYKHKTLTEQLIYAWDFENIKFEINFDIIDNYKKILSKEDKELYDSLYEEVHCMFW